MRKGLILTVVGTLSATFGVALGLPTCAVTAAPVSVPFLSVAPRRGAFVPISRGFSVTERPVGGITSAELEADAAVLRQRRGHIEQPWQLETQGGDLVLLTGPAISLDQLGPVLETGSWNVRLVMRKLPQNTQATVPLRLNNGAGAILPLASSTREHPSTRYLVGPAMFTGSAPKAQSVTYTRTPTGWTVRLVLGPFWSAVWKGLRHAYPGKTAAFVVDGLIWSLDDMSPNQQSGSLVAASGLGEVAAAGLADVVRYGPYHVPFGPADLVNFAAGWWGPALYKGSEPGPALVVQFPCPTGLDINDLVSAIQPKLRSLGITSAAVYLFNNRQTDKVTLGVQAFGSVVNPSALVRALQPLASPGLPIDDISIGGMEID
jgi:hypothetical protein